MTTYRKVYETTANIQNEYDLASELSAKWKCDFSRLPKFYAVDIAFSRNGQVMGFGEIKCRSLDVNAFDTYIISLKKYMSMQELSAKTTKPTYLIIKFGGGEVMYHKVKDGAITFKILMHGRKDRNDWQDIEPCVQIPLSLFEQVR